MKKLFYSIAFLLLAFNCTVYSQEIGESTASRNEFSVSTSSFKFNDLSLKYARLISDDLWLKLGAINLSGNWTKDNPSSGQFASKSNSFGGGLMVGLEKIKLLASKLELSYGLNAQMGYSSTRHKFDDPNMSVSSRVIKTDYFTPAIGGELGIFYKFSQSVLFGFELNPNIHYTYVSGKDQNNGTPYNTRSFGFSLTNNVAQITLKCRI